MTAEAKKPKQADTGKLPVASQCKSGWEPLGPYQGRKRPDGITRGWC